jgi:hypothetical protein
MPPPPLLKFSSLLSQMANKAHTAPVRFESGWRYAAIIKP